LTISKSAILFWAIFSGFVVSYILNKPFDNRISLTILILLLIIFLVKYWGENTIFLSKSGFDHKYISLDGYRWKRFKFVCYNTASGFYYILPLLLIGFGLILLIPIVNKDSGYVINILLPFAILFAITSFLNNLNYKTSLGPNFMFSHHSVAKLNGDKSIIVGIVTVILLILAIWFTKSLHYNPNNRFESRMTAFFSFNEVEEDGTINAEEQAQFFAVLAKNVKGSDDFNNYSFSRILSQPGTGVMHNDLSYPGIVISKMNKLFAVVFSFVYLFILVVLLLWVVKLTIAPNLFYTKGHSALFEPVLTLSGMVRIIAVGMLVGNAVWLLASYYNFVPFTGRLMYGMGQDSVGEVLDTTILFSLLLLTDKRNVK
jgi:hypothetical protein